MSEPTTLQLETEIIKMIKTIYDPEIPVNIYDLGLIYDLDVDEDHHVMINMTLTAPNCPVADILPAEVQTKVGKVPGVNSASVNLVFDPPWTKDLLSEEAMLQLGFL